VGNYSSPEDEEFFGAIGRLTISWAHLELGLDVMVEVLYYGVRENKVDGAIPRALGRKIDFLRAAFKRLPLPDDAAAGYESLFDAIKTASERRHDIIHGVVVEQIEGSGEAKMVRLLPKKGGERRRKEFDVTTKYILESAIEAQRLASKTLCWADGILDLIHERAEQCDEQA